MYDERIVPLASSHPAVRKFITVGRALVKTGMVIGREKADRYPVWILARLDVALDKFSLAPPTPRNYSRTESMARRTMAWHGCESQRPDNREDAGFGEDCEPEGAGADMMCSRCLTVRYCSTRASSPSFPPHSLWRPRRWADLATAPSRSPLSPPPQAIRSSIGKHTSPSARPPSGRRISDDDGTARETGSLSKEQSWTARDVPCSASLHSLSHRDCLLS